MSEQLAMLRGQVGDIVVGSIFFFIGLSACIIAALRRRSGVRIFLWLGIWSAIYGVMHITQSNLFVSTLPGWLQSASPYVNTTLTYLIVVAGALAFRELSLGKLRPVILAVALTGLAIAAAGIAFSIFTGVNDRMMLYNNLLAACLLIILTVVVAVPRLAQRYLVLPDRGVLAAGTLLFAVEALVANLARPLGFRIPIVLDHLAFASFLFSLGYNALQLVLGSEHRLQAVQRELAIASEIQASILPAAIPRIDKVRISASYLPMTEVAGDFYEFVPVDQSHLGILVADVSGHGVSAALIASMIKVGMQAVIPCASDPRAVLSGLNHVLFNPVLSGQLRGQFVSAAYLWIDSGSGKAMYSAAGHPPLMLWREGSLHRIESNGLLMGVMPECDDYPVSTISIQPNDRFLLYTDGVTEPENARGESFGDVRLEQVLREGQTQGPSELSDQMLSAIRLWQPAALTQQDDITLIVIDIG